MVRSRVIHFDVVYRGSLNWRISINGEDDHVPFATKQHCITAARARARHRHQDEGIHTDVRSADATGEMECIVRFMHPHELLQLCEQSARDSSHDLREACDQYGAAASRP